MNDTLVMNGPPACVKTKRASTAPSGDEQRYPQDKHSKLWLAVLAQQANNLSSGVLCQGNSGARNFSQQPLSCIALVVPVTSALIHFGEVPQGPRLRTEERSRPL